MKGINFLVLCGTALGLCALISIGFGAQGMVNKISQGAKTAADRESAVSSSREIIDEKKDHAAQLATLMSDRSVVVVATKQISPSTKTAGRLQKMRSIFRPGDIVTVGGASRQYPPIGTLVIDGGNQVAIVEDNGVIVNPFNRLAKHLPKMSSPAVGTASAAGQFRDDDLYVTPAEKFDEMAQPEIAEPQVVQPTEVAK